MKALQELDVAAEVASWLQRDRGEMLRKSWARRVLRETGAWRA